MDASRLLEECNVVPVVVLANAETAVPVAEALLEAGLDIIEVTLRTADALQGIEQIARKVPDVTVGVGSLRSPDQFAACVDAGATFGVSPGYSERMLEAASDYNMPFIPGAATPSEMIRLFEHGYRQQKFFPAELSGGRPFLKSVGAPLPDIRFMPTGGVTPQNAADYLELENVSCVGGTWLTPIHLQASGRFEDITELARTAAQFGR